MPLQNVSVCKRAISLFGIFVSMDLLSTPKRSRHQNPEARDGLPNHHFPCASFPIEKTPFQGVLGHLYCHLLPSILSLELPGQNGYHKERSNHWHSDLIWGGPQSNRGNRVVLRHFICNMSVDIFVSHCWLKKCLQGHARLEAVHWVNGFGGYTWLCVLRKPLLFLKDGPNPTDSAVCCLQTLVLCDISDDSWSHHATSLRRRFIRQGNHEQAPRKIAQTK